MHFVFFILQTLIGEFQNIGDGELAEFACNLARRTRAAASSSLSIVPLRHDARQLVSNKKILDFHYKGATKQKPYSPIRLGSDGRLLRT